MATLFADDYGWLVEAETLEQLCERLATVGIKAVEWRERKHVAFDNSKEEIIAFTKRRKRNLKRWLTEAQITVKEYIMRLNIEATRWVEKYLDTGLQFQAHKNISLEKAKHTENRVWRLG